ncbi:hypothetical protein cyc_08918 [Cyclospora cayetanensis]|uniref:Uncharacterized protein n=1 Tax=Cyclospora cayetanensis TaxID=88456 RepID=A0A1D3D826_9EIME|nr:hypothetical protein cyc_08918 [Cyclospora cayetanensis]
MKTKTQTSSATPLEGDLLQALRLPAPFREALADSRHHGLQTEDALQQRKQLIEACEAWIQERDALWRRRLRDALQQKDGSRSAATGAAASATGVEQELPEGGSSSNNASESGSRGCSNSVGANKGTESLRTPLPSRPVAHPKRLQRHRLQQAKPGVEALSSSACDNSTNKGSLERARAQAASVLEGISYIRLRKAVANLRQGQQSRNQEQQQQPGRRRAAGSIGGPSTKQQLIKDILLSPASSSPYEAIYVALR